jgi:hypothetical protein
MLYARQYERGVMTRHNKLTQSTSVILAGIARQIRLERICIYPKERIQGCIS